mmetsp:Transcript_109727/g.310416  ORF Transcript_109727/g.310416 Transcript_109727/m.310416 type:complete len:275 (-) Transcript_109727:68-892(-)
MAGSGGILGKRLTVQYRAEACTLVVIDKMEPGALAQALVGRFRLGAAPFYLTSEDGAHVVPLSSALPDGLTLVLHRSSEPALSVLCLDAAGRSQASEAPDVAGDPDNLPPNLAWQVGTLEEPLLLGERVRSRTASHDSTCSREIETLVQKFDRMSRLTTELANERTLLAWIRTGLAACRSELALFGAAVIEAMCRGPLYLLHMVMLIIVVVASLEGTLRYNRIKKILRMPEPPEEFGRFSLRWFNVVTILAGVVLVAGVCGRVLWPLAVSGGAV